MVIKEIQYVVLVVHLDVIKIIKYNMKDNKKEIANVILQKNVFNKDKDRVHNYYHIEDNY